MYVYAVYLHIYIYIQQLTTQASSVCLGNISHYLKLFQLCKTDMHGSKDVQWVFYIRVGFVAY